MRIKTRRWIFLLLLLISLSAGEDVKPTKPNNENENSRNVFSPRMDYEQWKPLGRGDPLQNDPTYDYVPPVLEHVHYWVDPALRKPDPPMPGENQKTEILLLGVSSKKPSTGGTSSAADARRDTYDPFLKFVEGPKFNNNQRISRPHYQIPSSYFPSPYYTNKKFAERTAFSKNTETRVPYTMLVPPPMVTKHDATSSTEAPVVYNYSTPAPSTSLGTTNTSPQVTVQAANLIYQSSSLSDASEFQKTVYYSTSTPSTIKDFREELVYNTHLQPPESYIHIEFAPHNLTSLIGADSNQNINYVTPPPLIKSDGTEVMFKGEVSDDNIDITNTYVKIGKSEAQMNIPEGIIRHRPLLRPNSNNMVVFSHMKHPVINELPKMSPMTMQTLQQLQTMQPPPITVSTATRTTNPIYTVLNREVATTTEIMSSSSFQTTEENILTTTTTEVPTTIMTTTTAAPSTTTTTTTPLTTDPLFKHYKQPAEPLKGPLYLIIQGHSKVKTYGPSKQVHGISVHETNEISDDSLVDYNIKHLHGFGNKDDGGKDAEEEMLRRGRSGNLQTLKHVVQTGLGAIDFSDLKRFHETELHAGYEIATGSDATTEKYHKGIVEEARKLKI